MNILSVCAKLPGRSCILFLEVSSFLPAFGLQFSASFLPGVPSSFLPVFCQEAHSQTAAQNCRRRIAHPRTQSKQTFETLVENLYITKKRNLVEKDPFWPSGCSLALVRFVSDPRNQFVYKCWQPPKSSCLQVFAIQLSTSVPSQGGLKQKL